jgi:hypothetical protein
LRVRLKESEAIVVIREAGEKVERWVRVTQREGGGRRRRRARGKNPGNERGGKSLDRARIEEERGGEEGEGRGSEEDSWERRATCGSPQEAPTTPYKSKLA